MRVAVVRSTELWERLEGLGWTFEHGTRVGTDVFFIKPGVLRSDRETKLGRDFFNSRKKVRESLASEGGGVADDDVAGDAGAKKTKR